MSWKEKINYSEMVKFCKIYRSKKEIQEKFNLTPIEAWHAIKWFSKFEDDFIVEKDTGNTSRAWWIKSTSDAFRYHNNYEMDSINKYI